VVHVACTGGKRDAHNILVGKAEVKRQLGKHAQRRYNCIKMYFREMGNAYVVRKIVTIGGLL
jgi:hypothetical protein